MAPIRCCFDQTAVWHSDAARGPSTPSFDHLVGEREQLVRNLEAERLGGRDVDDEIELGRLLDRQVVRLCPTQNPAPPSRSTEKSWLHLRPPPVDFCSSRLAIGAATERARALASRRERAPK